YLTTPQELVAIAEKASKKIQPYKDATDQVLAFAGEPSSWPYGTITGQQSCDKPLEPSYVGNGAPLILAKAMAYRLTGNTKYAATVREKILDLTGTSGYGGEKYS